jgi:transposase-like protein
MATNEIQGDGTVGAVARKRLTAEQWRDLLANQEASGQSHTEFCRQHGISASTYFVWRRKLGLDGSRQVRQKQEDGEHPLAEGGPALVPVHITMADSVLSDDTAFELCFEKGRVLRIPRHFDPTALGQLLAVLKGSC